jgi:signal transduction histidine kinase
VRRLLKSTVAWLVLAIFLLQLLSSGAAISLLRTQIRADAESSRTRELIDVRDDLMEVYYDRGRAGLAAFIAGRHGRTSDPTVFVALDGAGPAVLSNIDKVPQSVPTGQPGVVRTGHEVRGLLTDDGLALATPLPDGGRLVVGVSTVTDRSFDIAFAEAIGLTLALTVLLALASAAGIGLVISRRTHEIAKTAQALAAGDFGARLTTKETGDGFDHLRRQMNLMAERVDRLVRQLHSVTGALAHDLRSPVARLRAAIDTAQARSTDAGVTEALQAARADADALEAMLTTALDLSRLESGAVGDRRQALDLGEVVTDLVELYEPLAESSGVTLSVDAVRVDVLADRELISRALANLIDNALKYGGDQVQVTVQPVGRSAEIAVSDNGPGIASEDRERALGRFNRLDNARTRPGAGLGLAMVSAVAQLHGGEFVLSGCAGAGSSDGGAPGPSGLIATIRIPRHA